MDGFIARLIINTVALLVLPYIVPGVHIRDPLAALAAAIVLGLANAIIRPVLVLLSLPIQIITLGLFTLVINALMLLLAARIVAGFEIYGFWPAFWGAIVLSIVSGVLSWATAPLRGHH
ncbi:MAG TPA: phage holin family protein [Firmicutes bacterium]|nr:phage holin family protein [Bacillota bacterium]